MGRECQRWWTLLGILWWCVEESDNIHFHHSGCVDWKWQPTICSKNTTITTTSNVLNACRQDFFNISWHNYFKKLVPCHHNNPWGKRDKCKPCTDTGFLPTASVVFLDQFGCLKIALLTVWNEWQNLTMVHLWMTNSMMVRLGNNENIVTWRMFGGFIHNELPLSDENKTWSVIDSHCKKKFH